jgi:hypothetical protein
LKQYIFVIFPFISPTLSKVIIPNFYIFAICFYFFEKYLLNTLFFFPKYLIIVILTFGEIKK